jgi:hypothetical protein
MSLGDFEILSKLGNISAFIFMQAPVPIQVSIKLRELLMHKNTL